MNARYHTPMSTRRSPVATPSRQATRTEDWRHWPSVKGYIPNLPEGVTTYDIHKNLHRFGNVEFIKIEETRQGNFARTAFVNFKPPPPRRAPWDLVYANGIDFRVRYAEGEHTFKVKVLYAQVQPSDRLVESTVRRGVKYDPEVTLYGSSIDFGYLENPGRMVVKATKESHGDDGIRLILNLKKLEMEVHFPVAITSKGKATVRAYRFFVALDEQFSICEVPEGDSTSLVIHLNNVPWYSRQLKEAMQMSHDPKSFRWSANDTWSRQTDIVDLKDDYEVINNTPVSLHKLLNSINIARWTTFRVNIKPSIEKGQNSLNQFLTALTDFNVRVTRNPSFSHIYDKGTAVPFWDLVNGSSGQSWSEELSLPRRLDFDVRYQLEVCVSKGWLNEYTLGSEFLACLAAMPSRRAKQILIHVDTCEKRVYDPMSIFTDLRYTKPVRARPLPSNCAEIYHATITATGVVFHTPSVEITNRIVRKYQPYSDRFLRVRFEDDPYRGQSRLYPATNGRMKLIFERVRRTLRKGIVIGDRHYDFLAWGNSQLREHGAYFFASSQNPRITADDIRRDMGTFSREKVVAKRAARMGQCFSTTVPVPVLSRNSWRKDPIQDIKNGDYNFTDGVGKISPLAAHLVKSNLRLSGQHPPSAFQFRLGGCKGVLTVDPKLTGVNVQIRLSQYKFDCESDELEIIRVSEFWRPALNRQLILVLSALGVPDSVFLEKQEKCIKDLDAALENRNAALKALRDTVDPNQITLSVASMLEAGFSQIHEPFVASLLLLWRAWTLKYLKEKAKIPVPQGAFVLGVADETRILKGHLNDLQPGPTATQKEKEDSLPEIFMQYSDPQNNGARRIVEGTCIIARNPSLHRGDVRVVKAVNVPQLHHLCDVLVVPTTGDRDLPSMCSGGDLDGDDYVVIWDPDLIPQDWNPEAFHYHAPKPVTKDEISTEDIINFFYDYMQNDFLGRIANAHLAAADYLNEGVNSEPCLKLVELHSMAVDYPKTGVPAEMSRDLERNTWPHFMEKKRAPMYRSRKILGQLSDAVERASFQPHWEGAFDRRILMHSPSAELLETVRKLKKSYDESMRRIMAQHQISTEFEVWSTFVLDHSKAAPDYKFHEEIGQHAKTLKESYLDAFCQKAGGRDMESLAPFAITAYHLTHDELRDAQHKNRNVQDDGPDLGESAAPTEVEMPFISFPWVLQDTLQKIARNTPHPDEGHADAHESVLASGDKKSQAEDDFDDVRASLRWMPNGEHLPDPYVPVIPKNAVPQEVALGEKDEATPEIAAGIAPPLPATRQASLKELPLLKPPTSGGSDAPEGRSPTENSSIVSSNLSSMVTSTKTGSSTSPENLSPPLSAFPHSHALPGSFPASSDDRKHGEKPAALQQSTNIPNSQARAAENMPLKDPLLMTEEELRSLDVDDDEDEYAF
ncbi:hypothetical protein H2200_008413 [Cladophialophora chaetospira]|uniref:RNA-dependent RNA polymerase n=1 Tax=Cladophialophora chaetospira TaxID=386627 RepID=A0AA38X5Q6_9EURO|nr:hypothetical protein H2200_008413 [Cladophialophora chaetospira]